MAHSNPHASWCQVAAPIGKGSLGCRCYSPPPAGRRCCRLSRGRGAIGLFGNLRKRPRHGDRGKSHYLYGETTGPATPARRTTAKESDHRRTDPHKQYHFFPQVEIFPHVRIIQHIVLAVKRLLTYTTSRHRISSISSGELACSQ